MPLTRDNVRGIVHQGGTIIGTTNRGNPIAYPVQQPDGSWVEVDRTPSCSALFELHEIDALITIGGDGSLTIANHLSEAGLRVIGVPKTIDNDLEAHRGDLRLRHRRQLRDRVHRPPVLHRHVARSGDRGGGDGALCRMDRLNAGVAGGAHAILIPEIPYELAPVAAHDPRSASSGARSSRSWWWPRVLAPSAATVSVLAKAVGQAERLGGVGEKVAAEAGGADRQGGPHGGAGPPAARWTPTAFDRLLGLRFGAAGVRALDEGAGRHHGRALDARRP